MKKEVTLALTLVVSMLLSACGGGSGGFDATGQAGASASTTPVAPAAAQVRAATATNGNLLVNADFASGMTNWQDWGNDVVVDGASASGTSRALRVGTGDGGTGQNVLGITAGTRYRLSVDARVSDPSETVVVGVNMVDASGANITVQQVRISNTTYTVGSVDIVAPANAVKALVFIWKSNGPGYAFVDQVTFTVAPAAAANLITNSGFEAGLGGWQNWGNAAVVTGSSASGSYALRVGTGAGGVGNVVPGIQAGKSYSVAGQLKVSSASETGYLGLAFLDANGQSLLQQNVPVNSTSYTTAQLTLAAPANTVSALVYVWKNAGSGFAYADDIALSVAGGAPAPATDFGVVPLGVWPTTLLQAGRNTDAYWVEDGVWASSGLTRGNFTTIDGKNFEQYTGVSPVVGPNGEIAARIAWKWPTCCTEIKSFPSIISGQKPGWYNSWTTPGGFSVRLPDGSISQTYPSGRTPGSFLPLQLPIASLKTSFAHKHMSPPTGRGHLAYDMYLQSTPTQFNGFGIGVTHEIIVPVDYWGGYGVYPTRNPQWYDHDVTIDGILYHIYIYKDATGFVLSSWGGGWKFIVFEPDQPIPDGTVDLAKIVNYVATQKDVFGFPWATGKEYLVSVELGIEPQVGTGDIQVNNYRVWH